MRVLEQTLDPIGEMDTRGHSGMREWIRSFLGNFIKNPGIREHPDLVDKLIGLSEQAYIRTLDDADYCPGGMDFSVLDKYGPKIKEECLDHFYGCGNWIVKCHVEEYRPNRQKVSNS